MAGVPLKAMMELRGYTLDSEHAGELCTLEGHSERGTMRIVYTLPNSLERVRQVIAANADADRLVLVLEGASVHKRFAEIVRPGLEFFAQTETLMDPTRNVHVPRYSVEDATKHPERKLYPIMLAKEDIQARWRGWEPGTVVKALYADGKWTFRLVV